MTYEELLIESDSQNIDVREKDIPGYGGRIYKNRIAIHKGLKTSTEKGCVLAEEMGHYHTTSGDILDQADAGNRKQELRARTWAHDKMIGLSGIVQAYLRGCSNLYDVAEYLNVTEEFMAEALERYREKYGTGVKFQEYFITFEPYFGVLKTIN